jgi:aminoglycoside 6'-N-acetyltransferase I
MNIREVEQKDFPEWHRLRCSLYPECTKEQLHSELESIYFRRTVVGELDYSVWVAEQSPEKLVGFVEMSIRNNVEEYESDRVGYVESLFVDENFRRNGVARDLVKNGLEWIFQNNCTEVIVDTDKSYVGACAFYLNLGFVEILQRENEVFYKKNCGSENESRCFAL